MTAQEGLKSFVVALSNKEFEEVQAAAESLGMSLDEFTGFAIGETLGRRFRKNKTDATVHAIRRKPR